MATPNSQTWLRSACRLVYVLQDTEVSGERKKENVKKSPITREGCRGQAKIIKSYLARVDYTARAKPRARTHRQAALHLVRFVPHDAASVPTGDR